MWLWLRNVEKRERGLSSPPPWEPPTPLSSSPASPPFPQGARTPYQPAWEWTLTPGSQPPCLFSTGPQAPHHLASVPNIQENPFALWWTRERLTRSSVRGSLPSPTPLSTAGHVPRHGPCSPSLPHSSHWWPRLPPDPPSPRASPRCLQALSLWGCSRSLAAGSTRFPSGGAAPLEDAGWEGGGSSTAGTSGLTWWGLTGVSS